VAEEVNRLGVEGERIIVTPCAVDLDAFQDTGDGAGLRLQYGLEDAFVVGWTGSFRKFHGLGVLIDAAEVLRRRVPDLALILVGDGQERAAIEKAASERGLENVVFTGTVPYENMAAHVSAFDVAVVTAPTTADFHYSPLKLKEYMACGRAIVAPRVGSIRSTLQHEHEGLLVEPGDARALADALKILHESPSLRKSYGEAALTRVHSDGTWEHQVRRVLDRLPKS
jgi:glycosyltransferase involved in cell wall biosynthesis